MIKRIYILFLILSMYVVINAGEGAGLVLSRAQKDIQELSNKTQRSDETPENYVMGLIKGYNRNLRRLFYTFWAVTKNN